MPKQPHPAGITDNETQILYHLNEAWQNWLKLGEKFPDDTAEFQVSLHRLHQLLAVRVARRVDPDLWRPPAF